MFQCFSRWCDGGVKRHPCWLHGFRRVQRFAVFSRFAVFTDFRCFTIFGGFARIHAPTPGAGGRQESGPMGTTCHGAIAPRRTIAVNGEDVATTLQRCCTGPSAPAAAR